MAAEESMVLESTVITLLSARVMGRQGLRFAGKFLTGLGAALMPEAPFLRVPLFGRA